MRRPNRARSVAACASLLAIAAGAQPAAAQQADETIVVTGTRIPRPNFDTAQPAGVLDGEQVELRGYTNIGEALEELPAFGVASNSPVSGQPGAFGAGQTFVNFLGLGDQRTLTLVNGRRFVSSNTASTFGQAGAGSQVDLNVLPTILIDRIETIAVGGAPIYGSDAIAGTVNIIMKRDFTGLGLDAQYGISDRGDGREYRFRAAAGTEFGAGRGNITIAGEYNEADGLTFADRPNHRLNSAFTTPADPTAPFSQGYVADRRLPGVSQYGIPQVSDFLFVLSPTNAAVFGAAFGLPFPLQTGVTDNFADPLSGNPLVFNSSGELVPIDFGVETGDLISSDGGNGFVIPGNLLASTRRYLGAALASYELSDSTRLIGEAWYANSRGTQLAAQPEYSSSLFGSVGEPRGNLVIPLDNPFLSEQARTIIAANLAANPLSDSQDSFLLGRAHVDLLTGTASSTVELYRFVGGLEGTLDAFGRGLSYELIANYGHSTTKGEGRAIVQQNLLNALDAVLVGGQIVCAPSTNSAMPTISSTCAPLNPFGNAVSAAARDYVTAITDPRSENDQLVLTASLSGSLFDTPEGSVGFALGYEHRRETSDFDPGAFYRGGPDPDPTVDEDFDGIADNDRVPFGSSVIINPVSGAFDTDEFFAELNVPLFAGLQVNGAFRYIDHSLAGADPTYTIGATWQPVRDITLRGNYTRSVRAPGIGEYFAPTSQISVVANDPCDARFINGGANPEVRQRNCAADGLPDDFNSSIANASQPGTLTGNPDLINEKADSWTVGVVLRPSFLSGLTLAVDWIDIAVKDAVEELSATNVLNACYDSPDFPESVAPSGTDYCGLFERDFSLPGTPFYGQITSIETTFENATRRDFEGLVAELAWRVPTPFLGAESRIDLGVNYLYNHDLKLRVGAGDVTRLVTGLGYARHQGTANLTYSDRGFAWQWQAQYLGKANTEENAAPTDYEYPVVDDVVFFNSSMSYALDDGFRIHFIVDNVFDTKPPFPVPANGGTVTYFDGIFGRSFRVGAGIRF